MAEMTRIQRKDYAKTLFLTNLTMTQKEISERSGVSQKTISKWVNDENWDDLRTSLLTTREQQLANLYMQLRKLNEAILDREDQQYATSKEADVLIKLTSAIDKLEQDLSISDIVNVSKKFLDWVRHADLAKAKEMSNLFDAFIKDNIK